MVECPTSACLSKVAEDVQLKTNERQFLNVFRTIRIIVRPNQPQEIDVKEYIKNCAYRIWIGVPLTATYLYVRLNRQVNSDYNVCENTVQPVVFDNVLVDYIRLENTGDTEFTVTVHLATYLSRERLQQSGMENV